MKHLMIFNDGSKENVKRLKRILLASVNAMDSSVVNELFMKGKQLELIEAFPMSVFIFGKTIKNLFTLEEIVPGWGKPSRERAREFKQFPFDDTMSRGR